MLSIGTSSELWMVLSGPTPSVYPRVPAGSSMPDGKSSSRCAINSEVWKPCPTLLLLANPHVGRRSFYFAEPLRSPPDAVRFEHPDESGFPLSVCVATRSIIRFAVTRQPIFQEILNHLSPLSCPNYHILSLPAFGGSLFIVGTASLRRCGQIPASLRSHASRQS